MRKLWLWVILLMSFAPTQAQTQPITLTLAAYAVPREAYAKIIPLFQADWLRQTGQEVIFEESYLASGAQSRAVVGGFAADVVALSHEQHVTNIVNAGLITADWQDNPYNGMVSASVAVLVVRPGNPREIFDWADIAQPGIEVITPDPATSGGAQWNVMGAYGAAYRGQVEGYEAGEAGALQFITDVFINVSVMDADGRESFLTFERGIGDVAITYENEYFAGLAAGGEYEIIYPSSTILIENPVAVVDVYVDQNGTREVAEAFVAFLYTPEAQAAFAESGFRPPVIQIDPDIDVTPEVEPTPEATAEGETQFPVIEDLFTIEDFGGWEVVVPSIFGDDGIYTRMIAEVKGQ
ncbi:MAG: sulfate ABC transporter substrate-binding protein [Anaerolineae bacterium]|jgi:sulfate transport system substrate-binding protein|nr:sulfate ABC transporter substrate-binding protein [Anaerolineae bacterium]